MILSVFFRILPFTQNPSSAGYSFVSGKKRYALLIVPNICVKGTSNKGNTK